MDIEEIRNKITPILRDNNIEYAAVFGSVARGEDGPNSDVDVLVRVKHRTGWSIYISKTSPGRCFKQTR